MPAPTHPDIRAAHRAAIARILVILAQADASVDPDWGAAIEQIDAEIGNAPGLSLRADAAFDPARWTDAYHPEFWTELAAE